MDIWTTQDTELLTKLYVEDKLELLPICRIMKKKCKVITNKLIELQIVQNKKQVRGTGLVFVPNKETKDTTELSKPSKITSVIQILTGINQVINEVSNICESYSKITKNINQTSPTNPSK